MFRAGETETQAFTAVEEFQVCYEQFSAQFELPEDAVFEQAGAGGVSTEWISTPGVTEDRVVMYLHGGGYMIGALRKHQSPMPYLSWEFDALVPGLIYRMAPEQPFPAAVEDVAFFFRWIQGVDPRGISSTSGP